MRADFRLSAYIWPMRYATVIAILLAGCRFPLDLDLDTTDPDPTEPTQPDIVGVWLLEFIGPGPVDSKFLRTTQTFYIDGFGVTETYVPVVDLGSEGPRVFFWNIVDGNLLIFRTVDPETDEVTEDQWRYEIDGYKLKLYHEDHSDSEPILTYRRIADNPPTKYYQG